MTALPLCRWRGKKAPSPPEGPERHFCRSPRILCRDGAVSATTCLGCGLADHEPGQGDVPRGAVLEQTTEVPPCRYRKEVIPGATVPCASCPNGAALALRRCGLPEYGVCTDDPRRKAKGIHSCIGCKKAVAPEPEPRLLIPGLWDPIPGPQPESLPAGWHYREDVRDAHLAAINHLRTCPLPPPGPREGDGIVYAAGGKYRDMAVASIRLARELGCTLPIQVWHRGSHGEDFPESAVAGLDVRVIDIDKPPHDQRRAKRGWETKTHAILHSGFRRVLFLDADAYPLIDPARLFRHLDRAPFAFWRDHSTWLKGPWYGLTREEVEAVPPVQGGHYLVDVVRWWRALILAYFLDQHSDYTYARGTGAEKEDFHSFGDQDQLRAAILLTGLPYHVIGEAVGTDYGCAPEVGGRPVIVHRYASKMTRRSDVKPVGPALGARAVTLFRECDTRQRSWYTMLTPQYAAVTREISRRGPCNVLVFGGGEDTGLYVAANEGGRTAVLEDDPVWVGAAAAAGAEAHAVRYTTLRKRGLLEDCPPLELPEAVAGTRWDVVLIDGPFGDKDDAHGRQQSAMAAAALAAPGATIFAHDAQRGCDRDAYDRHLGDPSSVVAGPPDLAVYRRP